MHILNFEEFSQLILQYGSANGNIHSPIFSLIFHCLFFITAKLSTFTSFWPCIFLSWIDYLYPLLIFQSGCFSVLSVYRSVKIFFKKWTQALITKFWHHQLMVNICSHPHAIILKQIPNIIPFHLLTF